MPRRAVAAIILAVLFPLFAQAQSWPTRPVTMVVPFAAGGPMDVVGRIMALSLSEQLGQQVIVENVGGGGGMTGVGARRQSRARTASVRARQRWHPCREPVAVEEIRPTMSLPILRQWRCSPICRWCWSRARTCRREPSGVHRLRQGERGQDAVRLRERRLGDASWLRAAQRRDRRQRHPHPLSRRRPGDAGSCRRPDRLLCIDTPAVVSLIESGQIKAMAVLSGSRTASLPMCRRRRSRAWSASRRRTGRRSSCPRIRPRRSCRSCRRQAPRRSAPRLCKSA